MLAVRGVGAEGVGKPPRLRSSDVGCLQPTGQSSLDAPEQHAIKAGGTSMPDLHVRWRGETLPKDHTRIVTGQ